VGQGEHIASRVELGAAGAAEHLVRGVIQR
jgi:hypothetical protein